MQLSLQELVAQLVTFYQGINGLLVVFVNLFLVNPEQVEGNVEGIGFNCADKEVDLELNPGFLDEEQG